MHIPSKGILTHTRIDSIDFIGIELTDKEDRFLNANDSGSAPDVIRNGSANYKNVITSYF